jgi:hypothetical protein
MLKSTATLVINRVFLLAVTISLIRTFAGQSVCRLATGSPSDLLSQMSPAYAEILRALQ